MNDKAQSLIAHTVVLVTDFLLPTPNASLGQRALQIMNPAEHIFALPRLIF